MNQACWCGSELERCAHLTHLEIRDGSRAIAGTFADRPVITGGTLRAKLLLRRRDQMGSVKSPRVQIACADESRDTLRRRVMTSPLHRLIAPFEASFLVFDVAKAPSRMCTENFARSNHGLIFSRNSRKHTTRS